MATRGSHRTGRHAIHVGVLAILGRAFCDLLSITGAACDLRVSVLVLDIGTGEINFLAGIHALKHRWNWCFARHVATVFVMRRTAKELKNVRGRP